MAEAYTRAPQVGLLMKKIMKNQRRISVMVPVEGVQQVCNFNWLRLPTHQKPSIELQ
jgi:hypothetical protein